MNPQQKDLNERIEFILSGSSAVPYGKSWFTGAERGEVRLGRDPRGGQQSGDSYTATVVDPLPPDWRKQMGPVIGIITVRSQEPAPHNCGYNGQRPPLYEQYVFSENYMSSYSFGSVHNVLNTSGTCRLNLSWPRTITYSRASFKMLEDALKCCGRPYTTYSRGSVSIIDVPNETEYGVLISQFQQICKREHDAPEKELKINSLEQELQVATAKINSLEQELQVATAKKTSREAADQLVYEMFGVGNPF